MTSRPTPVAFINGDWILHQTINGEVSASVTLPPLQPSGGGFWQVIQTESGAVAWQGGEQEGLPCVDFFPAASGATGGSGGGAPPIEGFTLARRGSQSPKVQTMTRVEWFGSTVFPLLIRCSDGLRARGLWL